MILRIATRTSPLATTQAEWVASRLAELGHECSFVPIVTTGDVDQRQLTQIGGTGVFAAAVRGALLDGSADLAVHSLKDLPTADLPGLQLAAVPSREDPRDVLVGRRLADLAGATIGTGSPRRAVQLQALAATAGSPITIVPIRGNVDTRLRAVAEGRIDATVLAAAGLRRLDRLSEARGGAVTIRDGAGDHLTGELLAPQVVLPAAGQGALAIEIAAPARPEVQAAIAALDDPVSRARVSAERSFLATLEAGCLAPVGVLAEAEDLVNMSTLGLTLHTAVGRTVESDVASLDAVDLVHASLAGEIDPRSGAESMALGRTLARKVLAQLL